MMTDVTKDHQWIFENFCKVIKRRNNIRNLPIGKRFVVKSRRKCWWWFLVFALCNIIGANDAIASDSSSSNRSEQQEDSQYNRKKKISSERTLRSEMRTKQFDHFSFRSAREFESIDVKFEKFQWEILEVHGRRNVTKIIVTPIRNLSISHREWAMATLIDRATSASRANSLNRSTRIDHLHRFDRLRPPPSPANPIRVNDSELPTNSEEKIFNLGRPIYVANYPFNGTAETGELSFIKGDRLEIYDRQT